MLIQRDKSYCSNLWNILFVEMEIFSWFIRYLIQGTNEIINSSYRLNLQVLHSFVFSCCNVSRLCCQLPMVYDVCSWESSIYLE